MEIKGEASLQAESIPAYLRNTASGSIVYLLSLIQPLNLREIRDHSFRLQYVRTLSGREPKQSSLKGVVKKGVDCGVLVALATKRENYYFLNSDLGVRPPGLMDEDGEARVLHDDGTGGVSEDVCLPSAHSLGRDHPIPLLRDPSTCLGWIAWLTDSRRREILRCIQEHGPMSRKELSQTGTRVDLSTTMAGVRCGVLRVESDKVDFQFSATRIPPEGGSWTSRPPTFWFGRCYEPLRCIQGFDDYFERADRKSPMTLLREMANDGRKVIPSRRRSSLKVNMLYEASATVPRIEDVGPATIPSVWENKRGLLYPVLEGFERAEAAVRLTKELSGEEEAVRERGEDLSKLARRKLEKYFRRKEEELMKRLLKEKASRYGLGPEAITSLANVELERQRLVEERKHFERFLSLLVE